MPNSAKKSAMEKLKKKINLDTVKGIEERRENSQIKSAEKATLENHNASSGLFTHKNSNRGK